MFRIAILATAMALASGEAAAQLARPGALSTSSGCGRYSCVWVPARDPQLIDPTFKRAGYTYRVDAPTETGGTFVLRRGNETLLRTALDGLSASVAVTWAASNDAFALTWSDGGAIGNFHVRAFQLRNHRVSEIPAAERAVADFHARHYCETRGNNVQAYRWLQGASQLLLETSVYPTSDCGPDLGHFEGYLVRAQDGKILKHYSSRAWRKYMRQFPE